MTRNDKQHEQFIRELCTARGQNFDKVWEEINRADAFTLRKVLSPEIPERYC